MKLLRHICPLRLACLFLSTTYYIPAHAQSTPTRISQNSSGVGQNAEVGRPAISANGRQVVFTSNADNLVANDQNSSSDIFLRSLVTGALTRVNLSQSGEAADNDSFSPAISPQTPNGFLVVAYSSSATNLGRVPDRNGKRDIYFTIPARTRFTRRATFGYDGSAANGHSGDPSVTIVAEPNKILIAYQSDATNLVQNDTNGKRDIFLTTISEPADDEDESPLIPSRMKTIRISTPSDGTSESNGDSTNPQISGDGRFIVFESSATNLVSNIGTPTTRQIYVYEIQTGTISLVSRTANGTGGDSENRNPSINFSGTYICYASTSSDIVNDNNPPAAGSFQVLLFNRKTQQSSRVNTSTLGVSGNGVANSLLTAVVSPNGRAVIFADTADNLVSADQNGSSDIFLKDLATGETTRLSNGFDGSEPNGASASVTMGFPSFSSLQGTSSFGSDASNLVSSDTEGHTDLFAGLVTLTKPPLTSSTTLEVPPDLTPSSSAVSVSLAGFKGASLSKSSRSIRSKAKALSEYQVQIYREKDDGKRADLIRRLTKRTNLSFKNLNPGTYVVSYRAQIRVGNKIVAKTNFSPANRFKVS